MKLIKAVRLASPETPKAAVQQDWRALAYVIGSVQLKYPEIPLAAVQQDWRALKYVPEAVQLTYPKIPKTAVQQSYFGLALQFAPEALKVARPDICLAAVKKDGSALHFVPDALKVARPDICLAAVKKDGSALHFVPDALKTNVEALATLYTGGTQEQLMSDLKLLEITNHIICRVISKLACDIAQLSLSNDINNNVLGIIRSYIKVESDDVFNPAPYLYDIKQDDCSATKIMFFLLLCSDIPKAAMQKDWSALKCVLKTNVEALAKLYTGTETQLRRDLRLLEVKEEVVDKVANYYHHQIALSSDMIRECIAKPAQPEYQKDIPDKLLPLIGEYIMAPDDKKDVVFPT